MRCPSCNRDNRPDRRFCVQCGASLEGRCAACGAQHEPDEGFCGSCGARLRAASPDPPRDGDAERRQLTVMYCDLVGSTDLSQRVDAEDLRSIVRDYQQAAWQAIDRYGGHIAQYLGDGLLVYFGYPQAHEEDAERALRAGLGIVTALAALNDALEPKYGVRLAARVGIHTGPVVIGAMGGGARSETLALGDTTNIAARLEGVAEPDTVVISEATQRLVPGMFLLQDLGTPTLKGVAAPLHVYAVQRATGVRSRLDVAAGRLTPFVGRNLELATVVDRWERAQEGEGQTVIVLGEAGVGKSRLVYQLREQLAAAHTWLECGATPYTQRSPFQPVIELLKRGLALAAEDSPAEQLRKLEGGLRTLASTEAVALLAALLGLPAPGPLQMSPELQRRKTLELLVQWVLSQSAAQPLVLLVEDLHWCDASTLELLGQVIAQSPTARMLVLATARPEFTPPWRARSNVFTLQLGRLAKRQSREMIAALAGADLPAATVDALVARGDGVPLYVEELTKAATLAGAAGGLDAIPSSLADSLMARLDRLSTAKEVAQQAAVLGREFEYPLLAALASSDEAALRRELDRLVEAEILFARGAPPAAAYTFKHALIQDTAYRSLVRRARQELHARVARVLEERFPERVAAEPELIARHCDQAGLADRATAHYGRAGQRAQQRSAQDEAIGHFRRALDLVATLPETRERDRLELGLQVDLANSVAAVRGFLHPDLERARARARELVSRLGESAGVPEVLFGMALTHLVSGDLVLTAEIAQEALTAAEHNGEAFDLLSAHYMLGLALHYQGEYSRALHHFEHGVELHDPSAHDSIAHLIGFDRGSSAHGYAGLSQLFLGRSDRALARSEEAVALARRLEHPFCLVDPLLTAAAIQFERGELERARLFAEELVGLSERFGFPFYLGIGRLWRGRVRIHLDGAEAGLAEVQQGLADLAAIGSTIGATVAFHSLAEGFLKLGRHGDALRALADALTHSEQRGEHHLDASLHRLRAEILLDLDTAAVDEPEALLHQALEIARRQQAKTLELRAATSLARLWQRQGKRDAARALLAPLYAWFSEGFDTLDLRSAKSLLAELA